MKAPRSLVLIVGALIASAVGACNAVGPVTVSRDRIDYGTAIGESWKQEMSMLSNPPKHDPNVELIVDLQANDNGSADVTTQTDDERRVYRVENVGGKWLIRKYDWQPKL